MAPGFGSGHDLRVVRSNPTRGSVLSVESARGSLSLSFCPSCSCGLSLIINKSLKTIPWYKSNQLTTWRTCINQVHIKNLAKSLIEIIPCALKNLWVEYIQAYYLHIF